MSVVGIELVKEAHINVIVRKGLWLILLPHQVALRGVLVEANPAFEILIRCHTADEEAF